MLNIHIVDLEPNKVTYFIQLVALFEHTQFKCMEDDRQQRDYTFNSLFAMAC
jgi:hypothetical protein